MDRNYTIVNVLSLTTNCSFLTKWNLLAVFILDMQSSSLKLFSSFEQKAMLLKRQAFAVFSGELDQYHLYLPLIQGKKATSPIPPPSWMGPRLAETGRLPAWPTARPGRVVECSQEYSAGVTIEQLRKFISESETWF